MKRLILASLIVAAGACVFARAADTQEHDGPEVKVDEHTVVVADATPAAYLLVAHVDGEVIEARMIYGQEAVGEIEGASEVTIDVFRVDALGSIDLGRFKPCTPDDPDQPDCTPGGGYPPIVPPRFGRIDALLE